MSIDDLVLSEPKYVGNMSSTHREIPVRFRPASVCSIDGHCLHANKCFYNLYVKMPNVCYMRYCSDCKKILNGLPGPTKWDCQTNSSKLFGLRYDESGSKDIGISEK